MSAACAALRWSGWQTHGRGGLIDLLSCWACWAQDYTLINYDVNAWEGKAYAVGALCCAMPCRAAARAAGPGPAALRWAAMSCLPASWVLRGYEPPGSALPAHPLLLLQYGLQSLREMGCPVEGLRFEPSLVIRRVAGGC